MWCTAMKWKYTFKCVHIALHVDKKYFTTVWCWDAYANAYLISDIAVQNAVEMVVLLLHVIFSQCNLSYCVCIILQRGEF